MNVFGIKNLIEYCNGISTSSKCTHPNTLKVTRKTSEKTKQRLKFAERNQFRRQKIARTYNEAFAGLPIAVQEMSNGLNHNYHKYVIRLLDKNTRKRVKDALGASIHYETPLSANSMYESLHSRRDACTQSKTASDTVLSLPIHAWLTDDEVKQIIDIVKDTVNDI